MMMIKPLPAAHLKKMRRPFSEVESDPCGRGSSDAASQTRPVGRGAVLWRGDRWEDGGRPTRLYCSCYLAALHALHVVKHSIQIASLRWGPAGGTMRPLCCHSWVMISQEGFWGEIS